MTSWAKAMNKAVKAYDSLLVVKETHAGRYDLYRKSQTGANPPHFLFSFTNDWTPKGVSTEWGKEVVLSRIKAQDLWRDDKFIENYITQLEEESESKERAQQNNVESFFYDFRRQFQRATNDINTANLNKIYRKGY